MGNIFIHSGPNNRILLLLLTCLIAGCNNNFQPLDESMEKTYSMHGLLDLSADTNWVRVMPVRKSIERGLSQIDVEVSLIRESNNEAMQMHDTIMALPQNTYAWNFWTDEPLQASESYTVQAVSESGETVTATATIPPDFPTPTVLFNERTNRCHIAISDLAENIVVAEITYSFRLPIETSFQPDTSDIYYYTVSYLNSLEMVFSGWEFTVDELPRIASEYDVSVNDLINPKGEILIVSADENWVMTDPEEAQLPGVHSNVSSGLGVVSGIVSKRLPLRPNIEDQQDMIFCPPLN